jgi:hypothetical protein
MKLKEEEQYGINETGGKFCHQFPLVLLTPVANLPLVSTIRAANLPPVNDGGGKLPSVSTTPVANNGNNIRLQTP